MNQYYFSLRADPNESSTPIAILHPSENVFYLRKDKPPSPKRSQISSKVSNASDSESDNDTVELMDDGDDIVSKMCNFLAREFPNISDARLDALVALALNKPIPNELNDQKTKGMFAEFNEYFAKNKQLQFKGTSGFTPIPYQGNAGDGQRDTIFTGGASGIGKSTVIGAYAGEFNYMYPKSPIFIFSGKPLNSDPNNPYAQLENLTQVDLSTIDPTDYLKYSDPASGQSLVIFDDVESTSKDIYQKIEDLMKAILQLGRTAKIFCIISKHQMNDSKKTSFIWNECNKFILFPAGLSRWSTSRNLSMNLGLDKDVIKQITNTDSRYVFIQKNHPRYLITNNFVRLV